MKKNIKNHIIKYYENKSRELGDLNINDLLDRKDYLIELINQFEKTISEKKTEKYECKKELEDILEKLNANEKTKKLVQEKTELTEKLNKVYDEKKELTKELFDVYYKLFLSSCMNRTSNFIIPKIEELKKDGKIPPKIDKNFLEKILRNRRCICGREFDVQSYEYKRISELKNSIEYTPKEANELLAFEEILDKVKRETQESKTSLINVVEELGKRNESINKLENKIRILEDELINFQEDEINRLTKRSSQLEEKIKDIDMSLSKDYEELTRKQQELSKIEDQYLEELSKKKELEKYQKFISLANDAIKEIEKIKLNAMEKIRLEVEKNTNEKFKKMIWKKDTFRRVEITKDYFVKVYDIFDNSCFDSLSAGETQCLALAFIVALSTVSDFEFPYIIDTPFGRISSNEREKFARTLLDLSKKRQVIILSTDTEYDENVKSVMKLPEYNIYYLKFDE
ncbi:MAG: hypothetical protein N3A69_14150, partial [Leptospiraceae bacterium]|nr:hypothetical protein [Leptospiraceae bacterium]